MNTVQQKYSPWDIGEYEYITHENAHILARAIESRNIRHVRLEQFSRGKRVPLTSLLVPETIQSVTYDEEGRPMISGVSIDRPDYRLEFRVKANGFLVIQARKKRVRKTLPIFLDVLCVSDEYVQWVLSNKHIHKRDIQ